MVLDTLENAHLYTGLGPRFVAAFKFLREQNLATVRAGRHEIQGDDVYALVQDNQTKTGLTKYEAHKRYADVQYIVSGIERIAHMNVKQIEVTQAYDEANDYLLGEGGGGTVLQMRAGMFAVFSPQDAHMPNCALDQPSPVRKVVVKVRVG